MTEPQQPVGTATPGSGSEPETALPQNPNGQVETNDPAYDWDTVGYEDKDNVVIDGNKIPWSVAKAAILATVTKPASAGEQQVQPETPKSQNDDGEILGVLVREAFENRFNALSSKYPLLNADQVAEALKVRGAKNFAGMEDVMKALHAREMKRMESQMPLYAKLKESGNTNFNAENINSGASTPPKPGGQSVNNIRDSKAVENAVINFLTNK